MCIGVCLSKRIKGKHSHLRFQHRDMRPLPFIPPKQSQGYLAEGELTALLFLPKVLRQNGVLSTINWLVLPCHWLEFRDELCVMWGSVIARAGSWRGALGLGQPRAPLLLPFSHLFFTGHRLLPWLSCTRCFCGPLSLPLLFGAHVSSPRLTFPCGVPPMLFLPRRSMFIP